MIRVIESTETLTTLECTCPLCGESILMDVSTDQYRKWVTGTLVQYAFPEASPQDREHLVSGICPDCWDKFMTSDDDDDEEGSI